MVQPHLKKCFEGINQLCYDSEKKIIAMKSIEDEQVCFAYKISPEKANGLVEIWIKEVEDSMRQSLNIEASKAIKDYKNISRSEFIRNFPGQIVLVVSNIFWTSEVTQVIKQFFLYYSY
jgi:dynein heavy chain